MNTIATELEKATDDKKSDFEKELIELVITYESLEKYTSTSKQSNSIKRGIVRSTAQDIPANIELGNSKFFEERTPLLATSSICQLLLTALELYKCDCSNSTSTSQNRSQLSSIKSSSRCSKFISFILSSSIRQVKSFPFVGKDDPLMKLIYGDIKALGPPLLRLLWLLKAEQNFEVSQKKEAKAKKDGEERKELIHLALVCLKELIIVSLQSEDQMGLIEDMVSESILESTSTNVLGTDLDDECEVGYRSDDQNTRSKDLFLKKVIKPLFSELLAVSFFQEVEVNASLSTTFQSCTILKKRQVIW